MFDSAGQLRKATSRAKSDVANKLVSMLLHEISRKANAALGGSISDASYAQAIDKAFGSHCAYCGRVLENDRAVIEHLEGMNRFRVGLHISGNVAFSCVRCNREKRRDDQKQSSDLAESGWEAFLSHDGSRCTASCKTCHYWAGIWPDEKERQARLTLTMENIRAFREPYARFTKWNVSARTVIHIEVERLYRACQDFATCQIGEIIARLPLEFED